MKRRLIGIAAAAGWLMTAVCLVWIANLSEQIGRLDRNLSGRIDTLYTEVQGIGGEVRSTLAQEASLLAAWEATPGEPDFDGCTVPVRCTVIPKESSREMTATLVWSGGEAPMQREDNCYTVTVQVPLFEEVRLERVVFFEGERVLTEPLDWSFWGRYSCLLQVNAWLDGSFTAQEETFLREGTLQLDLVSPRQMAAPQSVTLLVRCDGREALRQELFPDGEQGIHDAGDYYYAAYPVAVQLPNPAQSCELWAEVLGQDGLVYRTLLNRYQAGGDGMLSDYGDDGSERPTEIYDREGNRLDPL